MRSREFIEWCNVWVSGADKNDLPRILLAGDSITQSYFPGVEKALEGRYRVARLTTSRCAGDPHLKRELGLVLTEFKFDLIHFNNGLHGWDCTEEAYGRGLADVMDFLRVKSRRSRLLWASSTPVWKAGTVALDTGKTGRVRARNRLAKALAMERMIPVNDLFAAVVGNGGLVSQDGVHFRPEGQEVLAAKVTRFLLKQA